MILPTEDFLSNIAKDKPASASSVWPGADLQPSFAVDGNGKRGSCFAGNSNDFSPWWQVDLQDTFVVIEVRVTNREEFRRKINICRLSSDMDVKLFQYTFISN